MKAKLRKRIYSEAKARHVSFETMSEQLIELGFSGLRAVEQNKSFIFSFSLGDDKKCFETFQAANGFIVKVSEHGFGIVREPYVPSVVVFDALEKYLSWTTRFLAGEFKSVSSVTP